MLSGEIVRSTMELHEETAGRAGELARPISLDRNDKLGLGGFTLRPSRGPQPVCFHLSNGQLPKSQQEGTLCPT